MHCPRCNCHHGTPSTTQTRLCDGCYEKLQTYTPLRQRHLTPSSMDRWLHATLSAPRAVSPYVTEGIEAHATRDPIGS